MARPIGACWSVCADLAIQFDRCGFALDDEIERLECLFAVPDMRPLSASDISRYGVCCRPEAAVIRLPGRES